MAERPYSRYTRERTWAALYSQHSNASYALVPYSATNNSIAVILCASPEEVQKKMAALFDHAEECAAYYERRLTPDQAPAILKGEKIREGVVLARSSDYWHYHLSDYPHFKLVICGLHDSYLNLTTWEMRTNRRYKAHETAVAIASPAFERIRGTQFGHNILIAALAEGDQDALTLKKKLPPRTQRRMDHEKDEIQHDRYRGRPLAFLTDAERREIGSKISAGLKRYHQNKR